MTRRGLAGLLAGALVALPVWTAVPAAQTGQAGAQALGSVRLPRKVMADGQPLAAGTYTVRVSADAVKPVVGQSPDSARWVEFVQSGQVKGRELATVLTAAQVKQVAEGAAPASGTSRVEVLKGNDYLRVWINRGGTHYLVHLATAPSI